MSISASDLFLSADLTEEEARQFLQTFGFTDPAAADERLQALADELAVRQALADLASLLLEAIRETPDPDGALAAFVHFTGTRSPRAGFLRYLREDPRALHVLIQVTGTSPFLGELLIASPEQFHWLVREVDRTPPDLWDLTSDAMHRLAEAANPDARRTALRHFHDRELLRIGTREILGRETAESTRAQLADLNEVVIGRALAIAREIVEATPARLGEIEGRFVVIASDPAASAQAELIYVYDCEDGVEALAAAHYDALARALTDVLSERVNGRPLQAVRHPAWFTDDGATTSARAFHALRQQLAASPSTDGATRAFLVKSRLVAGDRALGQAVQGLTEPRV